MKRKVLVSLLVIAVVAGLVGASTIAYYNDTETSTGNTFQSGTIDLAVNDENPWSSGAFEDFLDVKPSEVLLPFDVTFKNVGQNPGILTTSIDYSENDKPEDATCNGFEFSAACNSYWEMNADEFASLVYVIAVQYQYGDEGGTGSWHDDLPNWLAMDTNGDDKVSLYELKQASPIPYDPIGDPLIATAWITYRITFHLGDSLNPFEAAGAIQTAVEDNRPQADGVDVTVTGTLKQVGAP